MVHPVVRHPNGSNFPAFFELQIFQCTPKIQPVVRVVRGMDEVEVDVSAQPRQARFSRGFSVLVTVFVLWCVQCVVCSVYEGSAVER